MTCAKQLVIAVIVDPDGREWVGTNAVDRPQRACPRLAGEGYAKCSDVCRQPAHAEIAALRLAGENARGATMYLYGHTYVCTDCGLALARAGISGVVFK